MKKRKRGKQHVNAKKTSLDGIDFASGLEKNCYIALNKAKLYEGYENEEFQLMEPFKIENTCIERQANGKGDFKQRSISIRGIKYTPDFCGKDFVIECKGRANESFPIRFKMFKKLMFDNNDTRAIYKPQNMKDIEAMVEMILNNRT